VAGTIALITSSATTTGTTLSIVSTATTTGTLLNLTAAQATLSTGFYIACYDGTGNAFTVGGGGHLTSNLGGATAPTIAVTTQNGITAAAVTAGSTDTCGTFTTTGTNNNGGASVITVTFNQTYTAAPKYVGLMPANQAASKASGTGSTTIGNSAYISSITATTFVVTIPADATAEATPSWKYFVIA